MTWHQGGAPQEWSDVMVLVDPSLNGEGTDSDMPFHGRLVAILREKLGANPKSANGLHIAVWLSNVG